MEPGVRFRFDLAERLGMTVEQLETGEAVPLDSHEEMMWGLLAEIRADEAKQRSQMQKKGMRPR